MFLENIGIDARDPHLVGRFWEALLGCEPLTDEPGIYETRLAIGDGAYLDLCFPQVGHAPAPEPRLHVDLLGGDRQAEVVERALDLGARHLDIGQGGVPWVVLADPEGNPFCVMEERDVYTGTGPIAALVLESADPTATQRSGPRSPDGATQTASLPERCVIRRASARCSS